MPTAKSLGSEKRTVQRACSRISSNVAVLFVLVLLGNAGLIVAGLTGSPVLGSDVKHPSPSTRTQRQADQFPSPATRSMAPCAKSSAKTILAGQPTEGPDSGEEETGETDTSAKNSTGTQRVPAPSLNDILKGPPHSTDDRWFGPDQGGGGAGPVDECCPSHACCVRDDK
jgi:hypothetical protein